MKTRTFIIAEAGVNHNGSVRLARRLIDCAKKSGADAVKFQTFKADQVACASAPKAGYQKITCGRGGSQLEMLRKLELKDSDFAALAEHCRRKGIVFMSTAFDLPSVELLRKLRVPIFKVPSGEITNLLLLRAIGRLKKKVIISTGISTLDEVGCALNVLVKAGTGKKAITVLHCVSQYPAPFKDVNLNAMRTMRDKFSVKVGYSDHTPGIEAPVAAVALGARVIEKHLTLDRHMPGPDHAASIEPDQFAAMVHAIRNVESALGSGVKKPADSEKSNLSIVRRSIVAARDIPKGEKFSVLNLTVKRPGGGLSPMRWDKVIGRTAGRDFREDELIAI